MNSYKFSIGMLLSALVFFVHTGMADSTKPAPSQKASAPLMDGRPPLSNDLLMTPPMGWSSWNNFGVEINEALIIQTIDAMVKNGMRDAGYIYVNLDDGWQRYKGKRSEHPLEYDPQKFPRGIKYLADYAHKNGMKLGIYSGPGETTCAGYTGSIGHEEDDAKMFADWGVDYLKYDSCCSHKDANIAVMQKIFYNMSSALLSQKQPVALHACHCGWADIWQWGKEVGANHWRIGQDISDDFDYPDNREGYYFDVLDMIDRGVGLEKYTGPGHWNDYDMLIVGLNGQSKELVGAGASNIEYRTHFSMWSILSSPLLTGTDLRDLDQYTLQTLTNKEVIALNQDALGIQAARVAVDGEMQVFAKPLSDGSWAVALLNRGSPTIDYAFDWRKALGLSWSKAKIRDLWQHQDKGVFEQAYQVEVIGHEAKVLRLYRQ